MEEPKIVYEDNHFLIIHKPSGWLVQGDKTGDRTLTDWGRDYLKKKYQKPGDAFLHPTHRLDRPVSGITVFASTSKALERTNKLFRDDQVQKTYLAVVQGRPKNPAGKLTHWLDKDSKKNVVKAYSSMRGQAKKAELDYLLLATDKDSSLLRVMPKTGRAHQIRVQLSQMGCSIKGDLKYGFSEPNPNKSIHLHAYKISFMHPVKKELLSLRCEPNWSEFKDIIHELD